MSDRGDARTRFEAAATHHKALAYLVARLRQDYVIVGQDCNARLRWELTDDCYVEAGFSNGTYWCEGNWSAGRKSTHSGDIAFVKFHLKNWMDVNNTIFGN